MHLHHVCIPFRDDRSDSLLELEIDCAIDPGLSEVRRSDPGACDPPIPRHVESIESIEVTSVTVFDTASDGIQYRLAAGDGSLPPALAEVFKRQIEYRYAEDAEARETIDGRILRLSIPA